MQIDRLIEGGTRKLVIAIWPGWMRVAGASGTVARVFEIAHASRILQFAEDLASACRILSAESAAD
jgi:hypothetical protein